MTPAHSLVRRNRYRIRGGPTSRAEGGAAGEARARPRLRRRVTNPARCFARPVSVRKESRVRSDQSPGFGGSVKARPTPRAHATFLATLASAASEAEPALPMRVHGFLARHESPAITPGV